MSSILFRYIARQYLIAFLALIVIMGGVLYVFELAEILRRGSDQPNMSIAIGMELALLKLPQTLESITHFAVLFSAMFTFWRLTRSQELVVARAAGVSVWQFLAPMLIVAALIGLVRVTMVNPVSATLYDAFEAMEERYLLGRADRLDISRGGVWLLQRNGDDGGISVIFALGTEPGRIELNDAVFLRYDANNRYVGRVDAATAALEEGYWDLTGAVVTEGAGEPRRVGAMRIDTDLTPDSILESFASPRSMSFWELPDFIATLEATGFSSIQHRLQYESLLSQPLLLAAMIMLAAAFTLRHQRRGGTFPLVITGVSIGFGLFLLIDIVLALGTAETIPVELAAWAPAGVGLLLGSATLLHLEDG